MELLNDQLDPVNDHSGEGYITGGFMALRTTTQVTDWLWTITLHISHYILSI